MPAPLKHVYNAAFFYTFTRTITTVLSPFDTGAFQHQVFDASWNNLELKQRMRRLSTVLHNHLPGDYPSQVSCILRIIDVLEKQGEKGGFVYMFLPDFIEQYGLGDPETSLQAMERLTQFASCEFAIRPFLLAHQEKVMARMLAWSRHPHPHVRRFSSEGCRPRLPWAIAIPALKKDPLPILPILDNLKRDNSLFVRKSVANNLNDIAKDHPDVAAQVAQSWKDISPETDWIIRHGCRTLLKKAHPGAYALFALNTVVDCRVQHLTLSAGKLKIGDRLKFSFELHTGKEAAKFRLEYAVYYKKANGSQSRKIFQITEKTLQPAQTYSFKKEQRFEDFTTRKHYPGRHKLAIVVNGQEMDGKEFLLRQ